MAHERPWQLRMFAKTIKKKQRLKELRRLLGTLGPDEKCLLVTCGDNNGAINYHLRNLGGTWSWADLESRSISEMAELLGDQVALAFDDHLPFAENQFDCTVSIDVLEHIEQPERFAAELHRVTRSSGRILITVPGGDDRKLANRLKNAVGMTKEKYGHVREGFTAEQLQQIMRDCAIKPARTVTFSRFFTEMIELGINFMYVRKLSRNGQRTEEEGTIAPATQDQLRSVNKAYRLYSMIYPLVWAVSRLDTLLFFTNGHVVLVEGEKRDEP